MRAHQEFLRDGMQVRLLGFRFDVESKNLSLDSFAAAVSAQPTDQKAAQDSQRLLFLDNKCHPEYHVGMIVTVKDQKTFCRLVSGNGCLLVKVDELELDTKLMEFNFFVFNKATGTGLYQYYHQSCSLTSFGYLVARRFREYKESLIQAEIDKMPQDDRSDSKLTKTRKHFKGQLKWEMLVRAEKLQELIAEWERVKSFEWTIATPTVEQEDFKPLAPYIRNQKSKLAFEVGAPVSPLANAISALVTRLGIVKGRIEGQDAEGLDRVLRILNNPENYGEYDYDDRAGKLHDLDLTQFQNAWVVAELIKACKDQAHIFETPMQP
ncbi:hypothetical protein G7048_15760 [Diaphorobacter sp. HDW4B]|uniref:hypothetical protein n=1 Tax=Diaphorobacter sp. HDW4B TaxID=2714925 RepID=UPI001407365D|nr:hypothetical protein [Diaphorobacter sp. HDW4B]QIL71683.1 hypothetical protein G7048_15760 [Diaphorobacter sp. HDW4B]